MRRLGDRRDGTLIRDIDPMHYIMPLMYPNRCDNEAFMTMDIDIEETEKLIRKVNEGRSEEEKITLFGVVIAALLKTIYKRPQLNRFIVNKNLYQRNAYTAAFVVKKSLSDESGETLAKICADSESNLFSIQNQVNAQINQCKTTDDASTEAMGFIQKIPFKHLIGVLARWADRHGLMPQSIIATDPYQCSVVLTNLGSIGMNIGYHHLTNWGTNSLFVVIGQKKDKPVYDKNGNVTMKKVLKISVTVDERISDGFYFAKSLRLLKKYVENPKILLENFDE